MRSYRLPFLACCVLTLSAAVAQGQPVPATQPVSVQTHQAVYFHKSLVDSYETVGSRNPAWDANARRVLQLAARRWTTRQPDPDIDWQIMIIGDQAVWDGCDDPAVLYSVLRAHMSLETVFFPILLIRLDQNVLACKYAPFIKCYAMARLMEFADSLPKPETLQHLRQGIYDNLPGMLAEKDFPQSETAQFCSDITAFGVNLDGDRKPMTEKLHDILAKAGPASPIPDLFLGLMYWRYSWDAGGVGLPDAPGGNRAERHTFAREEFVRALGRDPKLAAASAAMVGTMVDEGAINDEMESYFQRAIHDDPDCYLAYQYKIGALNTGESGAAENLLKFGRTCLATKRWEARIPFLMFRAHRSIAGGDAFLPDFYRATPQAWQDAQDLYEGYIAFNPKAVTERIHYAMMALKTGHPQIARKQIKDLEPLTANPVFKTIIDKQEREIVEALK